MTPNEQRANEPAEAVGDAPTCAVASPVERALLQTVDAALLGVLLVAPLVVAGRHPLGKFVLISLCCLAGAAWCGAQALAPRRRWTSTAGQWIIAAAVGLLLLQLAPMSSSWLARLSPHTGELLPLWSTGNDPAAMGPWSQLTLTPAATRGGLMLLLAYGMLFLVAVQRMRRLADVERVLRWVAIAVTAMALLGIAQLLAGNGKFCWIYQHPSRTTGGVVRGSFPNENHFAHFLALGLGCLIWWAQGLMRDRAKQSSRFHTRTSWRDRQRLEPMLVCGALALVVLAGMLTFSRGGVAVLLLAGASCVALMTWQGLLNKKALLALAGVAVVLIAALGIHGYDKLSAEWGTVAQAETAEDLLDVRLALWQSHLRAIPQFFWTGTGAGSHAEIVPTYFDRYHAREFTHAENGPLQVLLELGVGGGLLLATGLGLSFWWLGVALWRRSSTRVTAAAIAVFAGLLVSVVHSLWDFAWYIPACMSITLILVACAVRLHRLSAADYDQKTEGVELPRLAWGGATVAVVMASAVMLHTTWGPALAGLHWDRYLIASYASNQQDLDAQQRHNLDAAMMTHLSNVLRHHPDHARANLRMTAVCLRRFDALQQHAENAIPLAQIRDAALASQFDSREALDRWLAAAVGDHRQLLDVALFRARQGLRGCPLQGGGYLYLAELSFLQGLPPETKADFVDQALRVRPHDGQVLFAAGREAIMAGDINGAMHRWKQAFHISPPLRREIVRMLGALPAPMLIQAFEPDLPGLTLIYRNYLDLGQPEQAALVAPLYLQALHKAADGATARRAANHWVAASQVHEKQGDAAAAVQCARKAVDADPSAFGAHRNLAHVLAAHGWHDEAVEHYQWCLHRKPDDQALRARMKAAVRGRLDAQSPASAAHPTASETSRR